MADLQRRFTKSGEVRYRDDVRQHRKRSLERKLDAQRFGRSVETDLLRRDWVDPRPRPGAVRGLGGDVD